MKSKFLVPAIAVAIAGLSFVAPYAYADKFSYSDSYAGDNDCSRTAALLELAYRLARCKHYEETK